MFIFFINSITNTCIHLFVHSLICSFLLFTTCLVYLINFFCSIISSFIYSIICSVICLIYSLNELTFIVQSFVCLAIYAHSFIHSLIYLNIQSFAWQFFIQLLKHIYSLLIVFMNLFIYLLFTCLLIHSTPEWLWVSRAVTDSLNEGDFTCVSVAQRRRVERVAAIPESVSVSGHTPGQRGGIQESMQTHTHTHTHTHAHTTWEAGYSDERLLKRLLCVLISVSAGFGDVLWVTEENQIHDWTVSDEQHEQPWDPADAGGQSDTHTHTHTHTHCNILITQYN